MRRLLAADDVALTPSGLSAVVCAVAGHMRQGARLLVDGGTYYETRSSLRFLAKREGWHVAEADLSSVDDIDRLSAEKFDVILCDHPRNWLLSTPDLDALGELARKHSALRIVDTSVQPLQPLTALGLADIVVCSLSKYPSGR